jgi:hypothetical protein
METDMIQLSKTCKKFKKLFRSLDPIRLGSRMCNPHLSDKALDRLKIDIHQLDVETGATSPPVRSYFLPRTDFPEISDACKQNLSLNWIWKYALEEEADAENGRESLERIYNLFPGSFELTFDLYSFEGSEDLKEQFSCIEPPRSKYGWIQDE